MIFSGIKKTIPSTTTAAAAAIEVTQENYKNYYMEKIVTDACTMTGSTDPNVILEHLPQLSKSDVDCIFKSTFGQSVNPTWTEMRHGRITSSHFYNIFTRVESLLLNPDQCIKSLLSHIMGYESPNPNIKSLKYGREMEPYAKEAYKKEYLKHKQHTDVLFEDSGLVVDNDIPYIASSPDLLVSCKCCGFGMVEIKCCLIPPCQVCSGFCKCKLPKCLKCDEYIHLRKNHPYYGQIQGQLAITKRDWCDLYIHTCNGSFTERITYDDVFYQNMLHHLKYFFTKYVIPEILTKDLQKQLQEEPMEVDNPSDNVVDDVMGNVYFCPICHCKIREPTMSGYSHRDQSIACDKCHLWYHFTCVHMTKSKARLLKEWACQYCA